MSDHKVEILSDVHFPSSSISGDPQQEDIPQFDNDNTVATTEFVQGVGLKFSDIVSVSQNTTLDNTHFGKVVLCDTGSGAYNLSLPDLTSYPLGTALTFISRNTSNTVLQAFSGQTITSKDESPAQSFTLLLGDSISLVKSSATNWLMYGVPGSQAFPAGSGLLNNGLYGYTEPIGGQFVSVESMIYMYTLQTATNGTRNVYLRQTGINSTEGYIIPKNAVLRGITAQVVDVAGNDVTVEVRKNGETTASATATILAGQKYVNIETSVVYNASDLIAVYMGSSSNFTNPIVQLTFSWKN